MTWYITSRDEYHARLAEVGAVYRDVIGRVFPTMAVVEVSALMEPEARVEIEATAVIPSSPLN
jgi:enamine deaminase RidA (YjgF/YER057c/UK114 family)